MRACHSLDVRWPARACIIPCMTRYRRNAGATFSLKFHLVWCPKYRRPVLVPPLDARLKEIIHEVLPTLWSRSYYAGSVGHVSAKTVEAYIAAQKGV